MLRIARADLADPRKRDVSIVLQKPVEHVLRPFQLMRDTRMAGDENGSRERERERQEASGRRMREALPNGSDHTPQITVFLGSLLSVRLFFSSPPPPTLDDSIPRYLRILTSPDDDLNNHYMRGRISQMKPLSFRSPPLAHSPPLEWEMGKTMGREDGQRTRGITR